jgi:hypothetical protein
MGYFFGPGNQSPTAAAIPVPGTIADLVWWLRADQILGTNGVAVPIVGNSTPWIGGPLAALATGTVTVDTPQLNKLNVLKWPGAATGRYALLNPLEFAGQVAVFAVVKPAASTNQTLLGSAASGLQVDVNSGANGFDITKATIGVIASSATPMTAGTWYQINVTWSAVTGAYSFRVGRASAGAATSTLQTITGNTVAIGYNAATNASDLASSLAELIVYDRILSTAQISAVEAYLNIKWGV